MLKKLSFISNHISTKNTGIFLAEPEENFLISFFFSLSFLLPLNLHSCILILSIIEKIRLEKLYQTQNLDFLINCPNCLPSLTKINHAFLTKSVLIDNSSYSLVGAIINENFYAIEEEKLVNIKIKRRNPDSILKKNDFQIHLEQIVFAGFLF